MFNVGFQRWKVFTYFITENPYQSKTIRSGRSSFSDLHAVSILVHLRTHVDFPFVEHILAPVSYRETIRLAALPKTPHYLPLGRSLAIHHGSRKDHVLMLTLGPKGCTFLCTADRTLGHTHSTFTHFDFEKCTHFSVNRSRGENMILTEVEGLSEVKKAKSKQKCTTMLF